jgi:phi13 family phage major tail protein
MAASKVRFNIHDVKYMTITEFTAQGADTSGQWVSVPGAVSIDLSPVGEQTNFYADGYAYYTTVANDGYDGDLVMAKIPDAMYQDIWGATVTTTSKLLTEDSDPEPTHVVLSFVIDGDDSSETFFLYNVMLTRPTVATETNAGSKQPQTQSVSLQARPLPTGETLARSTAETTAAMLETIFNTGVTSVPIA